MHTNSKPDEIDLVDEAVTELAVVRPDIDRAKIEAFCRVIYSGRLLEMTAARSISELGINYTELDVLGSLRNPDDDFELTPADLMRAAMVTSGAMSICLNRLEKNGLIRRRVSETDRRVRKVSLTQTGRDKIDAALEIRISHVHELLNELDAGEMNDLIATLRKITTAL